MGAGRFIITMVLTIATVASFAQSPQQIASQTKLAPNTTSTWEGTLIRDTLGPGGAPVAGEIIEFSVVTDGAGAATMVNVQVTGNGATLSASNELQCFTDSLITGNADSGGATEIFPSGDGYFFVFADDVPGGGLNGDEFFSNVNGSGILEGMGFDINTGQPIDLGVNQAQGNVNFNFQYQLLPEQSCGDSIFVGGTCSEPCSWLWEAQCVTNCDGNGKVRIEQSSYEVDEVAGSIDINLVRTQGSIGEVTVDYRTDIVNGGAASGLDYTFTSGTHTWADGDSAPKVVTVPILVDVPIEGPEDFLVTISNPTGGVELGAVASSTVTIEDRPDLAVTDLMIDIQTLELNGTAYTLPSVTAVITNVAQGGQDAVTPVASATDSSGSFLQNFNLPTLAPQQSTQIDFVYDITSALQAGDGLATGNQIIITVDPDDAILELSQSNNETTGDAVADVRPVVELLPSLTLENHFFLNGPVASNTIQAMVDWNGPMLSGNGEAPFGEVTFDLNGDQSLVPGTSGGAMTTYNMGSDFIAGFGCDSNSLLVSAEQNGFVSETLSESTTVFPFPLWVEWAIQNIPGSDSDFVSAVAPPVVDYMYFLAFPEPPFEATAQVPAIVPYFGGEIFGILETRATANVLAKSSGNGTIGLAGESGIAVASFEVAGEVSGEGTVQAVCGKSFDLLSATFGIDVTASITREQPLLEVIPGASVLTNIPLVGDLIDGIVQSIVLSGKIGLRGKISTTFQPDSTGALEFVSGTGRVGFPTNGTLSLRPLPNLSLVLSGGGEPFVIAKVPEPYFDQAGIQLIAQLVYDVYGFGDTLTRVVNCTIPGGCNVSDMATKAGIPGMAQGLLPRRHLKRSDYARFGPVTSKAVVNAGDTETVLVSNTFPRPRVSVAAGPGGRRLVTYVHDDPNDPAGRSTEVRSLFYDGTTWAAPVPIVDDMQPEFAPVVTYDSAGNGVAVWERSNLPTNVDVTVFDEPFAQSLEVVSSVWDGNGWSVPVAITNNAQMDHAVQLAASADGAVTAIWQHHDGASLLGTAGNPVAIEYATWDGTSWSVVATLTSGLSGLMQTSIAQRNADLAAVAFVRDTGSGGFDPLRTELFLANYDGVSWSAPIQITSDSLGDSAPRVAYDSDGALHLVWVHDGDLMWLRDSMVLADAVVVRPGSADAGFLNFELTADAAGNLAIVWPFSQGDGINLGYLIYDESANQWSQAQALQQDADVEGPLSAAFAADGSLQLAYIKTAMAFTDQEVDSPETGIFTVENVPTAGASDLVYFEHTLGLDATVSLIDLDPGNILPDQDYALAVSVTNSGDFSIDSLGLEVYQNDSLIDTQDLTNLVAGETRVVTINGNLGSLTRQEFRAVVDPAGALTEKNETNNELSLLLSGPIFGRVFADGFE